MVGTGDSMYRQMELVRSTVKQSFAINVVRTMKNPKGSLTKQLDQHGLLHRETVGCFVEDL